ncbi:MAG: M3 family peptidase [Gammaproteobacteria bacterium]|nr:MAG: M3 family peptidase [Gammaproteobacteria bacterium]
MPNPLLARNDLPRFSRIKAEHVEPAVEKVLETNRVRLREVLAPTTPVSWNTTLKPLEDMEDDLIRVWSPVAQLNSVVSSKALRGAYNACLPRLSEYHTELGQNRQLYEALKQIAEGDEYERITPAQRKILDDTLRGFRLSGVELPANKRRRFKTVMRRLSSLSATFEENLLDATDAWRTHVTDEKMLLGLPPGIKALARQEARNADRGGWMLTLEYPCYQAILTYAHNRELRREIYAAYVTRASDQGPHAGRWDNSKVIANMVKLRHEAADLLGYRNYAHYSLATKMAPSTAEVMKFIRELVRRARPVARRELKELRVFARQEGVDNLEAWDINYYSHRLCQERFGVSDEELKPYFPLEQVLEGLFEITRRLFGVRAAAKPKVDTWHKDIQYFELQDQRGNTRAGFYLDLYARARKRGGAWMDECCRRHRDEHGIRLPVAFINCNFAPPAGEHPSLLTHNDVVTLFHEFGHGLHHMLTRVEYSSVSGINGVEWDAVELPSQFLENWGWQYEALSLFARHYETGEVLPRSVYERMRSARNFQAGMKLLRQLEFALFDFRLHLEYKPEAPVGAHALLEDVRRKVAVITVPAFNRFAHGFSHLFGGGYAAGYYSYLWAEVLSADAFSRFLEKGIFDRRLGRDFRRSILEVGGSRDTMSSFIEFCGRQPQIEPLLDQYGLAA